MKKSTVEVEKKTKAKPTMNQEKKTKLVIKGSELDKSNKYIKIAKTQTDAEYMAQSQPNPGHYGYTFWKEGYGGVKLSLEGQSEIPYITKKRKANLAHLLDIRKRIRKGEKGFYSNK